MSSMPTPEVTPTQSTVENSQRVTDPADTMIGVDLGLNRLLVAAPGEAEPDVPGALVISDGVEGISMTASGTHSPSVTGWPPTRPQPRHRRSSPTARSSTSGSCLRYTRSLSTPTVTTPT